MTVTVTVDATWCLSRVEFSRSNEQIIGHGEVLLQETATPSPGVEILRGPNSFSDVTEPVKTYGAMPGAVINRSIKDVAEDTISIGDTDISFKTVMTALVLFFDKWRLEDIANPPQQPVPAELTPMPPPPPKVVVIPPPPVS